MSTQNETILTKEEDITAQINDIKPSGDKAVRGKKHDKPVKNNKDKKSSKGVKWIIIGAVAAVIVIFIIVSNAIAKSAPPIVMVTSPKKGSIEQTIEVSGTIKSLDTKTYYSLVDGTVDSVDVMVGDSVKKGQTLFTYDEEKLEKSVAKAELKKDATEGSYNNSIQTNGKTGAKLSEALTNLTILDEQVEFAQNYVDDLQKKIDDKKASISYEGALLQISLLETAPGTEDYLNLQKRIQENGYDQQYNDQVRAWQEELTEATRILNDLKTHQSEMKTQKKSAQDSAMTAGAKEELEANHESAVMDLEESLADLNEVQGGITADFDGVITKLNINEGANVAKGSEALVIESLENVVVEVSLTKIDLESVKMGQKATVTINGNTYDGEISHINKMAERNNSGSTVVGAQVKILNPDDNLVLGLEAKASILVGEANDAVLISNDIVNYDVDGPFVYVVENGAVVKRDIELGLINDLDAQVISGVGPDDQILKDKPEGVEEGTAVTAVPES